MSVDLKGIIDWLKGWFYTKEEVNTYLNAKANKNLTNANMNVVTDSSGNITTEAKPSIPDVSGKIDTAGTGLSKSGTTLNHSNSITAQTSTALKKIKYDNTGHITDASDVIGTDLPSHIHSISDVTNLHSTIDGIYDEIDGKADTSHTHSINDVTNLQSSLTNLSTRIGELEGVHAIEIVSQLGTASEDTMNKLYIVSENGKVNVYYTKVNKVDNTYEWHKMDADILDDLSIDWSDIEDNPFSSSTPSSFANATHTHTKSQITDFSHNHNTNELTDPNAHHTIGTSVNSTQTTINTKIEEAIDNIKTGLSNRKVFYVRYQDLPQDISDWGYEEMYIVNYGNEWRLYYWKEITSPYFHYDFEYISLSQKGESVTSIELVSKNDDPTGAIRLYYGDE